MISSSNTVYGFEKSTRESPGSRSGPGGIPGLTGDRQRKLFCCLCSSFITTVADKFSLAGAHTHYRVNPGGYSYVISCFYNAPGCAESGPPTAEHSWFGGYRWQVVSCRQCGEHLGWLFIGPDRFYGLINDKLITKDN